MTLLIAFCAGVLLAFVANVFALVLACAVCGAAYLVGLIAIGATHPVAATVVLFVAIQGGYALGMFANAYLPRRIVLGRSPGEARARNRPRAKGHLF